MAIAIDTSTPVVTAVTNSGTTTTSAAFSPPANSVIFVFFALNGATGVTAQSVTAMTDSLGSHLGWALFTGSRDNIRSGSTLDGDTEVWWASCPSAQTNMTVTATYAVINSNATVNPAGLMEVVVFTGAATTQNGNASIRNSTSTGTPSQTLVTSANNSWVFGVIQNWTSGTGPTPDANQTNAINGTSTIELDSTDGDAYWMQLQNNPTPASGTTVTIDDTAPTSIVFHFSMVEVLAAPTAPLVNTAAVTNVGPTSATGNGLVTSDGGSAITERGVCWNTLSNPTTANNKATASGTVGSYSASITGLSDNTLYHVRAYAINAIGTSYGNDVTFQDYPVGVAWL